MQSSSLPPTVSPPKTISMNMSSHNFIDTHYDIAKYAIEHGMHVLVTKPAVQLLNHHIELIQLAEKHKVVCFVEHHKRSIRIILKSTRG